MRRTIRGWGGVGRRWNWNLGWWWSRLGSTGVAALAMLAIIAVTVALLDVFGGGGGEARALAERIEEDGRHPVELLATAARGHRLLFLSDVYGSIEPKRLAAQAILTIGQGSGLDAVVLEVPASEQETIERYLDGEREDASILLANPRVLPGEGNEERQYLEIYRAVWRLNKELGPTRQIRILAADIPEWPPRRPLSPEQAARLFATRDSLMAQRIEEEIFGWNPQARLLLFVGGYHALKDGVLRLKSGGGSPVDVKPLAARLRERYASEVYSVLVDHTPWRMLTGPVAAYGGTRFHSLIREHLGELDAPAAVPVGPAFAYLPNPVREEAAPALSLQILPSGYRLADVADAYVYLGGRRGVQLDEAGGDGAELP